MTFPRGHARTSKLVALLGLAVASVGLAVAQGHGGGHGGPGGGGGERGGPFGGGGPNSPATITPRNTPLPGTVAGGNNSTESTMRGGLQLGPPGRWWDDSGFARTIGLNSFQQKRMDDVFSANKSTLVKLYRNLQSEEKALEKTTRTKDLDEVTIFQQIDRVNQARGELEKANAHMLLQLRKEMTPEQAARLDDHRSL